MPLYRPTVIVRQRHEQSNGERRGVKTTPRLGGVAIARQTPAWLEPEVEPEVSWASKTRLLPSRTVLTPGTWRLADTRFKVPSPFGRG
jgi:hypothetical protein